MPVTLYYAHDPMCSWCWAFRPAYDSLVEALPYSVKLVRLLGGLAPDNNKPMKEPMRRYIQSQWEKIQQLVPGTEFNFAFWDICHPRRSTYPACRAVLAARQQGSEYDDKMTFAIQKGYYRRARNPSDIETLVTLADEIGLDPKRFANDIASPAIEETLQAEIDQCHKLGLFAFPALLLANEKQHVPIDIDYLQPGENIRQILEAL